MARKGILSIQPSGVYLSWKSNPEVKHDDLQLAFAPGSYDTTKLISLEPFP